jgi:hypothetical protein
MFCLTTEFYDTLHGLMGLTETQKFAASIGSHVSTIEGMDCLRSSLVGQLTLRGESKMFGEWYQKTNKTEDTNKLTLLAFKTIANIHNTLLPTFIKLL